MLSYFEGAGNVRVINGEVITKLATDVLGRILALSLPLLLIAAFTAFILSGVQTKFIFNTKQIAFKFSRLNPLKGLKKTFSLRSSVHLVKSIVMIIVITLVAYSGIKGFVMNISSFYYLPVDKSVFLLANTVFDIFIKVFAVILAIGVFDYFYEWWQHEKDIRMTKQEVKDEYKLTEGNPEIKSAIHARQQRMAGMRMIQKVPQADVIIVNPEHFAVALKYDSVKNRAPTVIAKGRDFLALKIKEKAAENDIEIVENPPLARALYKAVEIDKEIPPEFYQAVAEVLSYVYSLKRRF
jgi:flagellar biosynthetic protein FlhB